MSKSKYTLIILIVYVLGINCSDEQNIEFCIDSKHHKKSPSKEDYLYKECKPWKDYSCCSVNTTVKVHSPENPYKFDYNHCSPHVMSDKCLQHFRRDLCFYECEPYVKPWVVKVNRTFASERIYNVPICADDCHQWWEDCQYDYTCTTNWARNFKWVNGFNYCHNVSDCRPMKEIYSGAQEFCESVWDYSWKYTPESEPCMRIWFNGTNGNPNRKTAKYYADIGFTNASPTSYSTNFVLVFISVLFLNYIQN